MRILYFTSQHPLQKFAESCFALTPKVSLIGLHDLYLEIEKTTPFFRTEKTLLLKAENLADIFLDSEYRWVLTDRPEWAKAFLSKTSTLLPSGKSFSLLQNLPIECLKEIGDPHEVEKQRKERNHLISFLKRIGFSSLRDFLNLPESSIHLRFGKLGSLLHEWAWGKRELPLEVLIPDDKIHETIEADDLYSLDSLVFQLRQVLVQVQARLQARTQLAKRLKLVFSFESAPAVTHFLELTEGTQDAQGLLRVLREFLQVFHWSSPLQQLHIEVCDTLPHCRGQLSFFDDAEQKFQDLAQYVNRLQIRLGKETVGFAQLKASHLPERSYELTWPPQPSAAFRDPFPARPFFLFTPPKPFIPSAAWQFYRTENLFTEWWAPGGHREYYLAKKGPDSLWVFQDLQKKAWFIHGSFD